MTATSNNRTSPRYHSTYRLGHLSHLWFILPCLTLLALIPRCLGLADFMTIDEPYHWIGRVRRFTEALATSDWAATNQTGHPGVTAMWLGSLGRWLARSDGLLDGGRAGNSVAFLAMLRLPLAVTNGLAVTLGFLLLRRLVRPQVAVVAALFWALSPFLIAHSRLLHLDALLTSFMTLSLLALLQLGEPSIHSSNGDDVDARRVRCCPADDQHSGNTLALVLAGVCGGLALLTKAPSLVLLPVTGLLLLLVSPPLPWSKRLLWATKRLGVWLGIALAVACIGWPALWVAPRATVMSVINEIVTNGGQPHHSGNFFLGREVGDPGWLFYPAVVLWRSSPFTLLGLALLPFVLRRSGNREQRTVLGLSLFALIFTLSLSVEPKKFDRYLLPIWPTLEILAAVGVAGMFLQEPKAKQQANKHDALFGAQRLAPGSRLGTLVVILALQLAWFHPYYIAYFNPLLGGGATAQRVMLVGWGEGMEQVGAWLQQRPDLRNGPVLSVIGPTLSPFVSGQVLDLQEKFFATNPSYAVIYARSQQRDESADAQAYVHQLTPLWTLQRYGIDYAQVYQFPRPFDTPVDAVFGTGLHLRGFSHSLVKNTLVITPSWDVQRDQAGGRVAFLHVIGPDGTRVAQADVPIDAGMFPQWQAGQQFGVPISLNLPDSLPPGAYRIALGVYDPADNGARLPITTGSALPAEVAGPNALLLYVIQN